MLSGFDVLAILTSYNSSLPTSSFPPKEPRPAALYALEATAHALEGLFRPRIGRR